VVVDLEHHLKMVVVAPGVLQALFLPLLELEFRDKETLVEAAPPQIVPVPAEAVPDKQVQPVLIVPEEEDKVAMD
jgi:hypothetical protein